MKGPARPIRTAMGYIDPSPARADHPYIQQFTEKGWVYDEESGTLTHPEAHPILRFENNADQEGETSTG